MSAEPETETCVVEIGGHRVLMLSDDAAVISSAEDVRRLIESAMGERVLVVAVPAEVLADDFLQLRTGLAGELLQKMQNYHLKFAVVGDISGHVAASKAFRDLVVEAERSNSIFFVPDVAALERRLLAAG